MTARGMPAGRWWTAGFVGLIAVLAVIAYLPAVPPLAMRSVIGLASAAAVLVGVAHHQPRRPVPWLLLAGALLAMTVGDAAHILLASLGYDPFPSVAEVIFLAGGFPLAIAAIVLLSRAGEPSADRASLLDALIVTAGLALLSWTFLVQPWLTEPALTYLERAVAVGYPVGGVLVLIAVARLAIAARWTPTVALLVVGAFGLIVGDTVYGVAQLGDGWTAGGPGDLGWYALYAGWGAAALHPSMTRLSEPRATPAGELSPHRLRALSLGALVALLVLVVEAARGTAGDIAVAAALTMSMLLLVLSRLAAAVGVQRRGAARERGLRVAGTALLGATGPDEVRSALRTAVAQLLPAGTPHRVAVSGQAPAEAPDTASDGEPFSSGATFVAVRDLPPRLAQDLGGTGTALQCPLSASGRTRYGYLYVAAREALLVTLPASLSVLATQAALAMERIRLTDQINRNASDQYFRALVQNAADVILIVGEDDRIRYASPSAAVTLGDGSLTGRRVQELVAAGDQAAVHRLLERLRRGAPEGGPTADWTVLAGDGRQRQVEARGRDLRGDQAVAGLVVTLRDVTEQRRLEQELTHRAYHDGLTGLANRDLLAQRVEEALVHSASQGSVVGVLFLDLDDLKLVNDTLGHAAGDELLIAAARRLATLLPANDTPARLGGDEFAVLVRDASTPQAVEQRAARVVAAFNEPFPLGGQLVRAAVSVGVATSEEAHTASDLLRQADLALYLAKGAGKAQWRRYEAARHHQVLSRMQLRSALSRAVAEEAFRLVYQPIVALDSGDIVGMEALVRWEHPTRGLVLPGEFIEEAEENGLIVPIGAWVLERALHDAAAWGCPAAADTPFLSVNVSARQLRQRNFPALVQAALTAADLPPERLVVELTERVLLRDDEHVWADLAALRAIGIRVAIDDFGTGYSSLSYLQQAPIDILKIERSFLDTIASSHSQLAVVDGIVRLAHTLELDVVAEGIETRHDRDLLQRVGCRYGQGHLFARPMRPPDAAGWLRQRRAQDPVAG